MKNVTIELGKEMLFSDNHLVRTTKGWIKAKNLKVKDKIFDMSGKITKITKVIRCAKRPDAPIVKQKNS